MVVPAPARNKLPMLGWGTASLGTYALMAQTVTGPETVMTWLGGYVLLWGLYLAAIPRVSAAGSGVGALVMGWAILARVLILPTDPWLSDDLYRYLLDGRVFEAGINPFRYPPSHPTVQAVAPELAALVNHPDVPTIYPPTIQFLGLFAAWLDLGTTGWRILMVCFDLALLPLLAALWGGGPRGWQAAAVYGWCPLSVWESAGNGHLEPVVILAWAAGVWAWRHSRWPWAALAIAAAGMAKFYPLLTAPAWLRRSNAVQVFALAGALTAGGTAGFAVGGVDVLAGMNTYLAHWTFNAPWFTTITAWGVSPGLARSFPFLVILAAGAVAALRRRRPEFTTPHLLFWFLVLGPTLHPWYALWVLPWLGPRPHLGLWAFVGAMGGGYAVWWSVAETGQWELPWVATLIMWGVVGIGWGLESRRSGSTPATVG